MPKYRFSHHLTGRSILLVVLLILANLHETVAQSEEPDWQTLTSGLLEASRSGSVVLVYVHARWCGPCRRMERDVFPKTDPLLRRLTLVSLDFEDRQSEIQVGNRAASPFDWARHYGIDRTPGWVLLDDQGVVIASATGFLDQRAFSLFLAYGSTRAYRYVSFSDYVQGSSL